METFFWEKIPIHVLAPMGHEPVCSDIPLKWEDERFKWVSFDVHYSPYTSYTSNLSSEYAMPDLLEYSFNINSFRTKEFHKNTSIITLGCSHTLGVGVPGHLIWPSFVSELTGIKDVINLGKPGASIAQQVRLLSTYIRKYGPPKIVLCNFPEVTRYEHITDAGEIVDGHTYRGMADNSYTEKQASTQSIIALATLEAICKANNILLRWQMWTDNPQRLEGQFFDNFENYIKNRYTGDFMMLKDAYVDSETDEICGKYTHEMWPGECCGDLRKRSNGCFNYGYDRYSVPKKYQKHDLIIENKELEKLKKSTLNIRDTVSMAHFGSHAHWHWAKNLVDSL
jgi:hypothetical protein